MTENTNPELYAIDPMAGHLHAWDYAAMFRPICLASEDREDHSRIIRDIQLAILQKSSRVAIGQTGRGAGIPTILWRAQEVIGKHEAASPKHAWERVPLNSLWIEPRFGILRRYRVLYSAPDGRGVVLPLRGHRREFERYEQWQVENPSLALVLKPGMTKKLQNLFGGDR